MKADHVKGRLHDAIKRGSGNVSEKELGDVTAVVLSIVAELTGELALVIAELALRVEALEQAAQAAN